MSPYSLIYKARLRQRTFTHTKKGGKKAMRRHLESLLIEAVSHDLTPWLIAAATLFIVGF